MFIDEAFHKLTDDWRSASAFSSTYRDSAQAIVAVVWTCSAGVSRRVEDVVRRRDVVATVKPDIKHSKTWYVSLTAVSNGKRGRMPN